MRKLLSTISCILLAIGMTACMDASGLNETHVDATTTEKSENYVIYFSPSLEDASVEAKENDDQVTYESADVNVFSLAGRTKIDRLNNVQEKKSLEINGKTYSLNYQYTYENALSSSKDFKEFSRYVSYKDDTTKAETRPGTNELLLFIDYYKINVESTGNITEARAEEIALETILSLYGQEVKDKYTYETTVCAYENSSKLYGVCVVYTKYVYGLPTTDRIQILVNMDGDVCSINSMYLGLFSNAEDRIEKEAVDNARAELRERFSENWLIFDEKLIVNANGEYYLSATLSSKGIVSEDSESAPFVVYINII